MSSNTEPEAATGGSVTDRATSVDVVDGGPVLVRQGVDHIRFLARDVLADCETVLGSFSCYRCAGRSTRDGERR